MRTVITSEDLKWSIFVNTLYVKLFKKKNLQNAPPPLYMFVTVDKNYFGMLMVCVIIYFTHAV
jgi:hypothetical protein